MNVGAVLVSTRAQGLLDYLSNAADYPFARLVGVEVKDGRDEIELVVEPELSQDRAVRIEVEEPIRLFFDHADRLPPSVVSTRPDFPIDLVHTSQVSESGTRCLCVWEENWADLRRNLTPQALTERIRQWFSRTACGELHQEGQSVEPLIAAAANTLILPPGAPPERWQISRVTEHNGNWVMVLGDIQRQEVDRFAVFSMTLPSKVHGALRSAPNDLEELNETVTTLGANLVEAFGDWLAEPAQMARANRVPILVCSIPILETEGGDVRGWEVWGFLSALPLHELGKRLGRTLSDAQDRSVVSIIRRPPELSGIDLMRWRVVRRRDSAEARLHAGRSAAADQNLVAIGAGAIGSNVVVNTIRAGIGRWTIIDDDVVLPHNTARQTQGDDDVGMLKAISTERLANRLLFDRTAEGMVANLLWPGAAAEDVERVVAAADVVVDFSASPAVLGHLADVERMKRCASFFFSPDGRDLVMLAEDIDRHLPLDAIEAQYFFAAATDRKLSGHFNTARLDLVRYGNACQDLSRPLPPWQVQTLCGLASGQLLALADHKAACARVWRLDPATGGIDPCEIALEAAQRLGAGTLRATVSHFALSRMRRLREAALPNETGGVLVGTFDAGRRIAHIVDALPAPVDSQQAPTYFIRGARELQPRMSELAAASAGALGYLGEWHSHPERAGTKPSSDDEGVWRHLDHHVGPTGTPHFMAICGDDRTYLRFGWRPHGREEFEIAHAGR